MGSWHMKRGCGSGVPMECGGQCPMPDGSWLVGLSSSGILALQPLLCHQLGMQHLVLQWKKVKRCRVRSPTCMSREGPDIVDPRDWEEQSMDPQSFTPYGSTAAH